MPEEHNRSHSHKFPFLTFQFKVEIGDNGKNNEIPDIYFQEVSGISAELQFETINEGGNNNTQLNLPTRAKYSNLVLKKGTLSPSSDLLDWCMSTITNESNLNNFQGGKFQDVTVRLINGRMNEILSWHFQSCYPVKWEISSFNAQKSEVAVETIEFTYKNFRVAT